MFTRLLFFFSTFFVIQAHRHVQNPHYITVQTCDRPETAQPVLVRPQDPPLISAMTLSNLDLVFSENTPYSAFATSKGVKVSLNIPPGIASPDVKAKYKYAKANINLYNEKKRHVATMNQKSYSRAQGTGDTMIMDLDKVLMDGSLTRKEFEQFLKKVTFSPAGQPVPFRLSGYSATKVDLIGPNGKQKPNVCMSEIKFDVLVKSITGMSLFTC